jgi:hypothetical protein
MLAENVGRCGYTLQDEARPTRSAMRSIVRVPPITGATPC